MWVHATAAHGSLLCGSLLCGSLLCGSLLSGSLLRGSLLCGSACCVAACCVAACCVAAYCVAAVLQQSQGSISVACSAVHVCIEKTRKSQRSRHPRGDLRLGRLRHLITTQRSTRPVRPATHRQGR